MGKQGYEGGDKGLAPSGAPEPSAVGRRSPRRSARRSQLWTIIALLAASVAAAAFLAGCSGDTDSNGKETAAAGGVSTQEGLAAVGSRNTITVMGKALVTSAPDEAVLTLSVENEGGDPGQALDTNSENTKKVVDRLKAEGLDDSAIETASVTVYPIRTYDPQTGKESLTGYRAQNTVTVTLKDALKVGKVFAAAVESGATNISGPVWRLSEDSAAVTEALTKAVADAKIKAEAVAAAQGLKLGDALMMNEGGVDVPDVRAYATAAGYESEDAVKVAEPPISPATLDITATITVTYAIAR